jgi:histidine ammonia-lyase
VPTLTVDRPPAPDIERISEMIASGEIDRASGIDLR